MGGRLCTMSNIIVDTDELGNEIVPEVAQIEEPTEEVVKAKAEPKGRFDDWDKDLAVTNYQELEKFTSRQGQEVGELRKQVAALAESQVTEQSASIDVDALLDNPQEAVNKSIASNPELQEMRDELNKMRQSTVVSKLQTTHPDFMDIINTPEYQNWVMDSPIRTEMHSRANNYDYDAGNELLSTFKERQQFVKTEVVKEVVEGNRKEALRAASSEGASSGSVAAKVFSQHELQQLNMADPDKYDAMLPEIMQAYIEGRVR